MESQKLSRNESGSGMFGPLRREYFRQRGGYTKGPEAKKSMTLIEVVLGMINQITSQKILKHSPLPPGRGLLARNMTLG